jgi:hypothetical protein
LELELELEEEILRVSKDSGSSFPGSVSIDFDEE